MNVPERKLLNYKLALALIAGKTVQEAADEAGVSVSTAYRRIDNPVFQRLYNRILESMIDRTVAIMAQTSTAAIQTLAAILKSEDGDAVRMDAAKTILDMTFNHRVAERMAKQAAALAMASAAGGSTPKETLSDAELEAVVAGGSRVGTDSPP